MKILEEITNPMELDVDDIFYEEVCGLDIAFQVIVKPQITQDDNGNDVYQWTAKNIETGAEVDYLINSGYRHYGPEIYRTVEVEDE